MTEDEVITLIKSQLAPGAYVGQATKLSKVSNQKVVPGYQWSLTVFCGGRLWLVQIDDETGEIISSF